MYIQLAKILGVIVLLGIPIPLVMGQGTCVKIRDGKYVRFPSSNFVSGAVAMYSDANCETPHSAGDINFNPGAVYASSPQGAWSTCESNLSDPIFNVWITSPTGPVWKCETNEDDATYGGVISLPASARGVRRVEIAQVSGNYDSQSALAACRAKEPQTIQATHTLGNHWSCWFVWSTNFGGGKAGGRIVVCSADVKLPLAGLRLHAFDGMNSGIQFRRLNNCGVGDPSIFEMGFLDAVDIWSNIGSGYSVCFPQLGRIVFLDAATSPRTLMDVDYVFDDGFTCAAMDRAGTMVLVQAADDSAAETPTTTRRPGTDDSINDAVDLLDCHVTPRYNLRLRQKPWGKIIDVIPLDTEVRAKARTENWFNVTYEETQGWSAAWLADSDSECNWTGVESDA